MYIEKVIYLLRIGILILNKFSEIFWVFKKKRKLECVFGRG